MSPHGASLITPFFPLLLAVAAFAEPAAIGEAISNQPICSATLATEKRLPWENELLSDLADGQLDNHQLFEAALIIGGAVTHESRMHAIQRRWGEILLDLPTIVSSTASTPENATQLMRFMHEKILTGEYSASCNALQRAFSDGDYNCVTATILFCCLAENCGLPVKPAYVPGHVRCRLIADPPCAIETTDPRWTACPQATHRDSTAGLQQGRLLNSTQLLAKLFYNRGLAMLSQRQYELALAATELSWQLDPHHDGAGENVATVINNWALVLCAETRFSESLQLLSRGQQLVPEHPILYANQAHILDCWARHRAKTSRN